jgi:hypothetical protein
VRKNKTEMAKAAAKSQNEKKAKNKTKIVRKRSQIDTRRWEVIIIELSWIRMGPSTRCVIRQSVN